MADALRVQNINDDIMALEWTLNCRDPSRSCLIKRMAVTSWNLLLDE